MELKKTLRLSCKNIVFESASSSCENLSFERFYNTVVIDADFFLLPEVLEHLILMENTTFIVYNEMITKHGILLRKILTTLKSKIDSITESFNRKNMWKRLHRNIFIFSTTKKSGFALPSINGILICYMILIYAGKRASFLEAVFGDSYILNTKSLKNIILTNKEKEFTAWMIKNFFVHKKKIYYISNNFFQFSKLMDKDHNIITYLSIIIGRTHDKTREIIGEYRLAIETNDTDKRSYAKLKEVHGEKVVNILNIFFNKKYTPYKKVGDVKFNSYKIMYNLYNFFRHISGRYSNSKIIDATRFYDVIPPLNLVSKFIPRGRIIKHQDYIETLVLKNHLEVKKEDIPPEWINSGGASITDMEKTKHQILTSTRSIKLVFEEMFSMLPTITETLVFGEPTESDCREVRMFIMCGDKCTGKSFIARKLKEYIEEKFRKDSDSEEEDNSDSEKEEDNNSDSEEEDNNSDSSIPEVIILTSLLSKINNAIHKEEAEFIIYDGTYCNKEYNRRTLKRELGEKIKKLTTLHITYIDVGIKRAMRHLLTRYIKYAMPYKNVDTQLAAGSYQNNYSCKNVVFLENIIWEESKDEDLFILETSEQIY